MPLSKTLAIALLAALATACHGAAEAGSVRAPATPPEHHVSCGPLSECATKAAELCPGGYQLLAFGETEWEPTDRDRMIVRCTKIGAPRT